MSKISLKGVWVGGDFGVGGGSFLGVRGCGGGLVVLWGGIGFGVGGGGVLVAGVLGVPAGA